MHTDVVHVGAVEESVSTFFVDICRHHHLQGDFRVYF